MKPSTVVLLTDFGTRDPYVGIVKGVILSRAPGTCLVDLTHEVPPGNVTAAAFLLGSSFEYFPRGTVFLVVVDPGVGGSRRAVAAESGGYWFVGPDNGLIPAALDGQPKGRILEILNPKRLLPNVSATFHGRDVFAPAAAHLAKGGSPSALGPAVVRLKPGRIPGPVRTRDGWRGEVLWVDRFGNLITNLEARHAGGIFRVEKKTLRGLSDHYAQVAAGKPLALLGSFGTIEVSVNGGRADVYFHSGVGGHVVVR